ncbi:AbrB/MazE/SpoVT family DNA-binding domain-containing protein [Ramlibacter sp. Leaf400]|uniref:AbrB/MazE/SpoVT family DNA-binding domain-containing protein n=1 Tax=Ramlibacter sp. Leaf400 TaxID=1736365 RepID=UPI0006F4BD74|nr:AbrB/MazE/SpoVT family DNA-binding domain-containing protein [Ramlibacter sp. Leaf400]KQT13519.1 hypothetical protein ASG30_19010 [Ramlibacter sp. Leaf400]
MHKLQLTEAGDSLAVVFPEEMLARLQLKVGDKLYLTEAPDGFLVTVRNPRYQRKLKALRATMKKWRTVLRELAR